jgi:outer membrane protein assembly factor BamB
MALLDAATGKQLWRTEVKSLPSSIAFATEKLIVAEIYKFEI